MPSEASQRHSKEENASQARQVIDVFHEISTLLVSGCLTTTMQANNFRLECRSRSGNFVNLYLIDREWSQSRGFSGSFVFIPAQILLLIVFSLLLGSWERSEKRCRRKYNRVVNEAMSLFFAVMMDMNPWGSGEGRFNGVTGSPQDSGGPSFPLADEKITSTGT